MGLLRNFIIIATCMVQGSHGFAPPTTTSTRRASLASSSFAPNQHNGAHAHLPGVKRSSSRNKILSTTSLSSSREQAERCLYESYPKFYSLLQQNQAALQRMRDSKTGFAVFAPSDAVIDSMEPSQLQLLESAFNDPELQQVLSRMAAYHMVSAPMTAEIMGTYNVVSTRVGELPVEMGQDGMLYVNGVQIIQSYQFEDQIVQNYQDSEGNLLGSEAMEGSGKICIIHEVAGFVCPDELWHAMYSHYQSSSGVGTM